MNAQASPRWWFVADPAGVGLGSRLLRGSDPLVTSLEHR